ncbi:MAG: efflux transporter outer membrane subunit [Pseudoxanthomonas sp.]
MSCNRSPNPRRGIRPAALACALLLAGCASSGGLAPQAAPIDANGLQAGQSLQGAARADARLPAQDWWKALGDPQLDALIDEALAGTPSLAAADARLRAAQAQTRLSDAERKPSLSVSGQYAAAQLPSSMVGDELGGSLQYSAVATLSFKWSPDIWGGKRAAWEAEVGQARAAEVDAQAARLALSANIARAYIGLSEAVEARDLARREQQRSSSLQELSGQRVRAGLDNQLQLRQAEAALASARAEEQAAQQQIDAARNALAALLGKGPDRGLAIAEPKLLAAPAPQVPAVLPSELLAQRADVVAARWRVEAAGHGIAARKAAFKPSFNLNALVGLVAPNFGDLFDSDSAFGFGGPAIGLPVFEGGRLRAGLAAADAQYDQAVAAYDQALVDALQQVADAVQSTNSLDARAATLAQARDAAAGALDLASQRYRAGLGTQLDVLSAQRPLLQLEQQLAGVRAQRYAASVDLDQALGGGLKPVAPPSSSDTASVHSP